MGLCNSLESHHYLDYSECSICLEKINSELVTLECGHSYHQECISKWLDIETTCPYCRKIAIIKYTLCIILRNKQRELCFH